MRKFSRSISIVEAGTRCWIETISARGSLTARSRGSTTWPYLISEVPNRTSNFDGRISGSKFLSPRFATSGSIPCSAHATDCTFVYGRTPAFCTRFSRKANSLISADILVAPPSSRLSIPYQWTEAGLRGLRICRLCVTESDGFHPRAKLADFRQRLFPARRRHTNSQDARSRVLSSAGGAD